MAACAVGGAAASPFTSIREEKEYSRAFASDAEAPLRDVLLSPLPSLKLSCTDYKRENVVCTGHTHMQEACYGEARGGLRGVAGL